MNIPQTQHQNYDILYSLSIITSIILAGVSEAIKKCEQFPGPPLCIQQGGAPVQEKPAPVQEKPAPVQEKPAPVQEKPAPVNSKWLSTFKHLASTVNDTLHNVVENVSSRALDTVEQYVLGDLGTKQLDKGILEQLQTKAALLGKMTRDPKVQQALKDMAEELSILGIQMADTVKPTLDRMVDKAIVTLNRTATRGAKGVMNTGMNIIEALLGEIPIAGGIIALVLAFLRGFNTAMLTAAPGVEFSTEAFFTAFYASIKMLQDFLKVQPRLAQEANAVRTAVQNMIPSSADVTTFAKKGQELGNTYATKVLSEVQKPLSKEKKKLKQDGGRANVQRKIQHITKRLKKTINRFTKKFRH